MHLTKSQIGSQFYRFPLDSLTAEDCLTAKTPMINGKEVEILQIAYIEKVHCNIIIEFSYVEKDDICIKK